MSDEIAWTPVLAWSTAVGFQIVTALRQGIGRIRQSRAAHDKNCERCRLRRGEIRQGWRAVIPLNHYWTDAPGHVLAEYVRVALQCNTTNSTSRSTTTFAYDIPVVSKLGSRFFYEYRRYSLISSEKATLFVFVGDENEWQMKFRTQYFGCRTIVTAFQKKVNGTATDIFRIVIADAFIRRQPRAFDVQTPSEKARVISVFYESVPSCRLMILYGFWAQKNRLDPDIGDVLSWRLELHLVAYEFGQLQADNQQTPTQWTSSESISIPGGGRDVARWFNLTASAILLVLYYSSNPSAEDTYLCVTFETQKKWRVETYAEWLARTAKTVGGARMLNAMQSIKDMRVSLESKPLGPLYHLLLLNMYVNEGAIFGRHMRCGILRRWCKPPPLKLIAAELLFRARPVLTRDQLQQATGFDVFDDIPNEKDDTNLPIVYM